MGLKTNTIITLENNEKYCGDNKAPDCENCLKKLWRDINGCSGNTD